MPTRPTHRTAGRVRHHTRRSRRRGTRSTTRCGTRKRFNCPPSGDRLAEQEQAQCGLARAEALVRAARTYWYREIERLWDAAVQDCPISVELRTAQRIANLLVTEYCVSAVLDGGPGFRDVHTAAQHFQVQEGRWETTGRVLLGLEPGSPVL